MALASGEKVAEQQVGPTGDGVEIAGLICQPGFGVDARLLGGDFTGGQHQTENGHSLLFSKKLPGPPSWAKGVLAAGR